MADCRVHWVDAIPAASAEALAVAPLADVPHAAEAARHGVAAGAAQAAAGLPLAAVPHAAEAAPHAVAAAVAQAAGGLPTADVPHAAAVRHEVVAAPTAAPAAGATRLAAAPVPQGEHSRSYEDCAAEFQAVAAPYCQSAAAGPAARSLDARHSVVVERCCVPACAEHYFLAAAHCWDELC